MRESEFFDAIGAINKKRCDLFTNEIRFSRKYKSLVQNPTKCTGDSERQLLTMLDSLDEHLHYNNAEFLWQEFTRNPEKLLEEATNTLNEIEKLVHAIDWAD